MERLFCEIKVGENKFDFVTDIEIVSTWKEFTDTAKLTIPKRITKNGEPITNGTGSIFKRGDKVEIKLGYFPNLTLRFSGYVSAVKIATPIEIEIENQMFLLKQSTFTKSYKKVDLKTLLNDMIGGKIAINSVDADLGAFRITNVTPLQVLDELKKTYYLDCFVQGGTLYVGRQYIAENRVDHQIVMERDVIDNDLIWKNEEETKIKLKAISMLPDNKKIEIEVGDPDGEQRTAHYYDLTESTLKTIAESEIKKFKFTGFRGGFTMFGTPKIKHGDVIVLKSYKLPERNGTYFVDSVETTFGQNGFRQKIELGRKAEQ
jgi:hypothetical protein